MWPAIVTGLIAVLTLLGLIAQRSPDLFSKIISNSLNISYMFIFCVVGYYFGMSEGIDSSLEYLKSSNIDETSSTLGLLDLKPNGLWLFLIGLLPMAILAVLYSIRHVANNVKKSESVNNET